MVVAGFEHEFAQIPESHHSGVELLLRQRLVTQTSSGKLVPSSDFIDSIGQPNARTRCGSFAEQWQIGWHLH